MCLYIKGSEKFYSQKTWLSWFNPVFAIFLDIIHIISTATCVL